MIRIKEKSQTVKDTSPKLKLHKVSNLEFKKNHIVSSIYFKQSVYSSDFSDEKIDSIMENENEELFKYVIKPLNTIIHQKEEGIEKTQQNKYYTIKEIYFLNKLVIKNKRNKHIIETKTNYKNNYQYNTETSSFIQLKKLQSEDICGSRQSNTFKQFTDEICLEKRVKILIKDQKNQFAKKII